MNGFSRALCSLLILIGIIIPIINSQNADEQSEEYHYDTDYDIGTGISSGIVNTASYVIRNRMPLQRVAYETQTMDTKMALLEVENAGYEMDDSVKPPKWDYTGPFRHHNCLRECSTDPSKKMICEYNFELEYYITMSKACGNCTVNHGDCFKEGCIPADGVRRVIATVNRQMPGPSIRVCEGDTVKVHVHNDLDEPSSIHWHGIHQKNTPWMDGVPGITQCPIPPKASFTYEFDTPLGGTYFWHSHSGFQRADGIYGSLIVRKAPEKEEYGPLKQNVYQFDYPEHEIIVMDWQEQFTRDVFVNTVFGQTSLQPRNALVNGKGFGRDHFNTSQATGIMASVEKIFIEKDKAYRLRFISNGVMSCPLQISIESHTMTVIATDGFDIIPKIVDSLVIYAGERWDVVVKGDQEAGSYWIKFKGLNVCRGNVYQVAVLNYLEAFPVVLPSEFITNWTMADAPRRGTQLNSFNVSTSCSYQGCHRKHIDVSNLETLVDNDTEILTQKNPDHKFYLSFDFNEIHHAHNGDGGRHKQSKVATIMNKEYTPQINFVTFVMPKTPLLTQENDDVDKYLCDNQENLSDQKRGRFLDNRNCSAEFCACAHLLNVKLNSVVEIILIDIGAPLNASHPFHLHGHSFRVVGMEQLGLTTTVEKVKDLDKKELLRRVTANAPIKDTVNVPDGGYTIIRFRADNPGFWYFHCHIEFHVEVGMGLVFQVGEREDMLRIPPNFPKCGTHTPSEKSTSRPQITTSTTPTQTPRPGSDSGTFRNPIDTSGVRPSIYFNQQTGFYYWTYAVQNKIFIRKSSKLTNWSGATVQKVYSHLPSDSIIGATEIQQIGSEFYMYFDVTSTSRQNQERSLYVIKTRGAPDSNYEGATELIPKNFRNMPKSPTVMAHGGQLYLIWSDVLSNYGKYPGIILISKMKSPREIDGPALILREPTDNADSWEGRINENAHVVYDGRSAFLLFSANDETSKNYCVSMSQIPGGQNPLDARNWRKIDKCLFSADPLERIYSLGHFSVTTSADGNDPWLVYEATEGTEVNEGKSVRAQRLAFGDGNLLFPKIRGLSTQIKLPAGEY